MRGKINRAALLVACAYQSAISGCARLLPSRQGVLILALCILSFLAAPVTYATAAVGRTRGSFAVSPTGAGNYTIPLWTPKGIAHLQPSLALVYSSQNGDGLFGMGWGLSGLSAISRCNHTVGQDGKAGGVTLNGGDAYCLDGNELRLFSGTYSEPGATYQTEVADFSLITSEGSQDGYPTWFQVQGKDGLTYQYGNTADSALHAATNEPTIVWALNSVSDRYGNTIAYDYYNDTTNNQLRPKSITYTTPSAAGVQGTPQYQILFTYAQRPDPFTKYEIGTPTTTLYYTTQISVNAWNGSAYALTRYYAFGYVAGATTGKSLLQTVTECSPTQCFPATTIGYQSGTAGWDSGTYSSGVPSTALNLMHADLNGDGIEDLVYQTAGGAWYYLIGQTNGVYLGPYSVGFSSTTAAGSNGTLLDFYGKGSVSLLIPNSSNNWRVLSFSTVGAAFTYVDTTVPVVPYSYAADVYGNGLQGLAYVTSNSVRYRPNTGGALGAEVVLYTANANVAIGHLIGGSYLPNSTSKKIDFNGDGVSDFVFWAYCSVCSPGYNYYYAVLMSQTPTSPGSLPTYKETVILEDAVAATQVPPLIGDFNGDGCSDIVLPTQGASTLQLLYGACAQYHVSGFTGFSAPSATGLATATFTALSAADWNGDGYTDILAFNGSVWGYSVSNALTPNFSTWLSLGSAVQAQVVTDGNGDGQDDLVGITSSGLGYWRHSGATIDADLANSFTDGLGVNYSPTYAQLTNSSVYLKGSGAVYPEQDIQTPLSVVSSYSASDGVGGTYTVSKVYSTARQDLTRADFEGFASISSVDSRDGLHRYSLFGQLFPLTGLISAQRVYQSDNATFILDVENTLSSATLDATYKRYFPYISQSVASTYEFGGGSLNGTLITQKTATVSFNGPNGFAYGNPSQIVTTTVDKDPQSPWPGATFIDTLNITPYEVGGAPPTTWCIHLPSQVAEQRTRPDGTTLTHTTAYAVNANSECEIDSRTVEPSGTVDKLVTAFGYDGCGNVSSVTVTGQIPSGNSTSAVRTTGTSYGSHCIFPEVLTNALSQQIQLAYRYDLGLPASVTDPNTLLTSWTYNDIGQKTLEQRPDGTQTSYSFAACSNHCGSTAPLEYRVIISDQDATSNHATFRQRNDYYDQGDRLIVDEVQSPGNQWVTIETDYDNLGRVHDQNSPTTGSVTTAYYTTYNYDLLNRLKSISRPTSSTNSTLEYTNYNYEGRTATVQDPKGNTTTFQTDVIGELGIVTDPDGTSKTQYGYDPFSHVISIIDPGNNQTTRTLDTLGYLLTATSDPDRGNWSFQYDSFGELINLRDAKTSAPNWTQELTYDAIGRITQRIETEGTTTWTWGTSAANHEIGRLKQLSGLGDTDTNTFDSAGRPYTRSMQFGGTTYTIGYAYNTIGKLSTLTYPLAAGQASPFAVSYGYTNGYLSSVQNYTGGVAGTTFWQLTPAVAGMDAWGHVVDETLGTTTAVRIQSAFDGVTGWITSRNVGSGGSLNNIQNVAYQWDPNGNMSQRHDVIQNLTEAFNYDNLNRLQTSTLNGTQNLSLSIDNTGNISSRTEGGIAYPYTYDSTHKHAVHTVGSGGNQTTYAYDANGNMSTRNGSSLGWTSYNLPAVINGTGNVSSAFTYGPDRRLLEQVGTYVADGESGTETTTYAFGLYENEITPAQTHNKYFVQVPGGTQIIYDIQSSSGTQTTYITADHLGSGNVFLNGAGTEKINESFSAYGYRRSSNWSGPLPSTSSDYTTIASTTRRGYTGAFHEVLDNLDLTHMNGRVYDPVIGRFLSPDPVAARVGDSQSGNPYSYVENRPLTLIDPTGLAAHACRCHFPGDPFGITVDGNVPTFTANGVGAFDLAQADAMNLNNAQIELAIGHGLPVQNGQPVQIAITQNTEASQFQGDEEFRDCSACKDIYLGSVGPTDVNLLGTYNPTTGRMGGSGLDDDLFYSLRPLLDQNYGSFGLKVANAGINTLNTFAEEALWAGAGELAGVAVGALRLARLAKIVAGNGSGLTVLGNRGYRELAQSLGANYLSLADWEAMSVPEQETAIKAFIDAAIARGDNFVFATAPEAATGWFAFEVRYLQELGVLPVFH